jgi:hypothetical protein
MAIEAMEQALQEPNAAPAQPGITGLSGASVIERHLKALADLPDLAPVLRATCQQLSEQWAQIVEKAMPQPERFRLLSRLVGGTRVN